jgi:cobalt-zinc-cadmium efflux system membrane fusion protein
MKFYKMYGLATWLAVMSCSGSDNNTGSEVATEDQALELLPQQVAMAEVRTGHIEYRMISGVVSATGEIDVPPEAKAVVTAPSGGYIVENTLLPGMPVKKGQRLAKLTNPEYVTLQQEYLETSSELKFAEQDYHRQQTLEEQNATALKKLQQSESTYNTLKGRLAGLKARLEMIGVEIAALEGGNIQPAISIKAPISGYIASANFARGSYVEAKEVIFEIVNTDDMHVELNVFEQHIAKVANGQKMRIRAIGSEATYNGTVLLISPQRNADQRTFSVHGHIDNPGKELRAGMFVEASIMMNSDTVPALPEGAIVYQDTRPCVLVGQGSRFELRPVQTGAKLDGWVEIMNPGSLMQESIVTEGAARVLAAMKKG